MSAMEEIPQGDQPIKKKKSKPAEPGEPERPFEEALKELEQLASQMERGDLTLDDAVAAYERGIQLSKHCRKKLDEAEGKIQKLTAEAGLSEFLPEGSGD